jgi:EmrB/QacA subfamily drug resistance transporter
MVVLDITVVNVALPAIGFDLGFAAGDLQWVVTAYVIVSGGLLLLGGRMADLLGRRPVFLAGLGLFTAASLASGLATSPEALIASRAAQGLGAAMLSPAALSIITTAYSGSQRTTALSVWGAIGAGGAAAGMLFGGMLVTWLSWEWIFFINVPVGIATGTLALHLLPASAAKRHSLRGLDVSGALAVVGGLVVLVYAIEGAGTHGWDSARTLLLLALSAGLLLLFARIERGTAEPLVPPSTWRVPSLVSSAAVMLGATGTLVGAFFLNSLFLQNVMGASALETGLAFMPLAVMIGVAAHAAPHLLAQLGARAVIVAGLAMVAAGNLLLAGGPADAAYAADLLPGLVLIGFGVGFAFVAASVGSMAEISPERAGLASGLMTTAHEIGAAFGVAIFSAVALGSGAAVVTGSAFVEGHGDGSLAGAVIAGTLALLALITVPAIRPASAQHVTMH